VSLGHVRGAVPIRADRST